ncbi:ABC transporter substrate-binding protein [Ectothiorhodospiraceae bacterium 2226]|nr:ABC transporter substrate-binding protein [Ectothiorhodospiraceae bacterium 2226]
MLRAGWRGARCFVLIAFALGLLAALIGCHPPPSDDTLVFKHAKLFGDPRALRALLDDFEARTGLTVRQELLPSGSDEQRQSYVIDLRGRAASFDVFAVDVIWVPEFAAAGWLRDLTDALHPDTRAALFDGPREAVTYRGRLYAAPWFIDAGLLYYRKDVLARHDTAPPESWAELRAAAQRIAPQEGMYGFVWQGRQYEGLVTNVLEYLWSNGGEVWRDGAPVIDSPANREALSFLVALVQRDGVTPRFVTTLTEEPARRIFGDGNALFLRNWPYAWALFERPESAVRGRVGVSALPRFAGGEAAATLGGWQLAVNPHSRRPQQAEALVAYLTSREAQKALALAYGFQPARRDLYDDPELRAAQPQLALFYPIFEQARPRPVSAHYARLSQILQAEFSAAVAGVKSPEAALRDAQRQAEAALF